MQGRLDCYLDKKVLGFLCGQAELLANELVDGGRLSEDDKQFLSDFRPFLRGAASRFGGRKGAEDDQ